MPVRYLLDTNTASYIIKSNFPKVREHLLKVPMADVGISSVTEAELRFGVALIPGARRLTIAVEEFLLHLAILPWDSACAKHYADIRAAIERVGEPMGNMDMMIASQALAADMTLVTHDQVFGRIQKLKRVDWTR